MRATFFSVCVVSLCAASLMLCAGGCSRFIVAASAAPMSDAEATRQIRDLLAQSVLAKYHAGERPAKRDAHAKAQGCVKARFTVHDGLAAGLRTGIFSHPRTYTAWIRFSNAVGGDDHAALAHGMAIKLTGVPGLKILPAERNATTQDFLLVNFPVFNVHTDAEYVAFLRESQKGMPEAFFRRHPESARITAAIAALRVSNPLEQRYFSMTPYALGSQVVKYSATPIACTTGTPLHDPGKPIPSDPNYLRGAMSDWLRTKPSCFTFTVQPRTDAAAMPTDNSTVLWNEQRAPFLPVASVIIPAQRFESSEEQSFCENLSFTPWHTLPAHRPLGNINAIRRVVYETISALRHRLNGVPRKEPTGAEQFPRSPTW